MQLTLRAIAGGSITERDRLLEYTIGELYQELSLFVQENEMKKNELDKLNRK